MTQARTLVMLWALAGSALLLVVSANQQQYERFLLQHVHCNPRGRDDAYCNRQMRYMLREDRRRDPNPGKKICKEINTFIHETKDAIRAVCQGGGSEYVTRSGQVMHRSFSSFQVTTCRFHGGKPLENCRYRASRDSRRIVIACDEDRNPVHFEESHI
ncbi:angiogenin-4 [Alligator mississippiensis]|uniref:angiogenin-4 n=1 Tax=Alligator mississippiensis TaxID=8496 RepID=UPI00287795FB|nr:angiogenin-4 [Alligator mississippiensis]